MEEHERKPTVPARYLWFPRLLIGAFLVAVGVFVLLQSHAPGGIGADELRDATKDIIDQLVDAGAIGGGVDLNDPLLLEHRTIVVSGDIDAHAARQVVKQLLYLDAREPGKPIDLYIRTQGGWGGDAYAICDVMERIASPVNTWALGSCDSAGAIVLAAGTGVRRAMTHTVISIHVNEEAGEAQYSEERTEREREERFWRSRAKLPESFFPMVGDTFYVLTAADALKLGVIDEIHSRAR